MFKFIVGLLIFASACISQTRLSSESPIVSLCWDNVSTDTAGVFLLYYREYPKSVAGDTLWNYITSTKKTLCDVQINNKKSVIFGVRLVIRGDTSLMHSSLDSSACSSLAGCESACTLPGPWYLNWPINKPNGVRFNKVSGKK